jgi:RimJ/RimL family protein N-acetyltransferase
MLEQPTLRTERLTLRPFRLEDVPRVQELAGAREVADTTLAIPHPYPAGAAEAWISTHATAWMNRMGVNYAIVPDAVGELVGAISLSNDMQHQCGEIGYWIAPAFWNVGYCTEAGRALLAVGFDVLKLHRIESRHFARNPASGRVMQKLGMQREGFQRHALRKSGDFEDVVLYAILSTDRAR